VVHGGLLRDATKEGRLANLAGASWMASHRTVADDASEDEKRRNYGNNEADKAAGAAREEAEREAGDDKLKDAEATCTTLKHSMRLVGSILALWPPLPRVDDRLPYEGKGALKVDHDWKYVALRSYWRCEACGCFCGRPKADGPPVSAGPCRPGRAAERLIQA